VNAFQEGEDRDVLIGFRVLDEHFARAKAGIKVWLSCDQYATGDFKQFHQWANKTVCISNFHAKYFAEHYDIFDAVSIPIPVRMSDYVGIVDKKVHQRCLFSSVPDRGLDILAIAWPRIVQQVPEASLVITSDYRLWNQPNPFNDRHRQAFIRMPNVQFMGAVPRLRLLQEQMKAEVMPYSSEYPELFCIAVAEAEYAGCWPITSDIGALATTNMGTVIKGDAKNYAWIDQFVTETVTELQKSNEDCEHRADLIHHWANIQFNPRDILDQWNREVFNGK
jgi:glycosyltransferase involved in cell wall biosynthesis